MMKMMIMIKSRPRGNEADDDDDERQACRSDNAGCPRMSSLLQLVSHFFKVRCSPRNNTFTLLRAITINGRPHPPTPPPTG